MQIDEIRKELAIVCKVLRKDPNNYLANRRKEMLINERRKLRAAGPNRKYTITLSDEELDVLLDLTSKQTILNDRFRELRS